MFKKDPRTSGKKQIKYCLYNMFSLNLQQLLFQRTLNNLAYETTNPGVGIDDGGLSRALLPLLELCRREHHRPYLHGFRWLSRQDGDRCIGMSVAHMFFHYLQ